MLTRLLIPAIAVACASVSLAQPTTTDKQPAKTKAPAKIEAPVKKSSDSSKQTTDGVTLKAGSRAPAIAVNKWIKGEAVTGFEKGKVYVVEFWATWCPPCVKSIPHLTKLQKDHKELTVIGVTSSERKDPDGTDNRLAKLEKFVSDKGAQMDYTIAYDADRKMAETWLRAAGKNGIPCAFIVDHEGKIAWIGNPLDKTFDGEVEKALKGSKGMKSTTDAAKPSAPTTAPKTAPTKEKK